jgi:hypothetical protein
MELQMKEEIIEDLQRFNKRLLVHEERVENSKFVIVPVWETVEPEDIQTPSDIYNTIISEGYKVDYLRIPMYYCFFIVALMNKHLSQQFLMILLIVFLERRLEVLLYSIVNLVEVVQQPPCR